jgi:hypothetical protein
MERSQSYPILTSVKLNKSNSETFTDFLFNPNTNKGFSVEGLAALFCRNLDGKKSLERLIIDFENEHSLESGKFKNEIYSLITDLEKNNLIEFLESPKDVS